MIAIVVTTQETECVIVNVTITQETETVIATIIPEVEKVLAMMTWQVASQALEEMQVADATMISKIA